MIPVAASTAGRRLDLAAVGLVGALLFLVSLGARDLWNPNEPTYGQAVAEMLRRGDYLVPTVGGRVFAEKPILYYWMAIACSRALGGVSELALRLPLAGCGIASTILVYLLVEPAAGRWRARASAVLYATTFMVYWGARSVQMDFLVAVFTLGSVVAAVRTVDGGLARGAGWTLAGLSAGLGLAAKGPVGVVLPALIVLLYLAATRRTAALRTPALVFGLAALFAAGLPWYLALLARGRTDVLAEVLYRQNVVRFLGAWDHPQPWWYYLKYFWIDMAPWAWFLPLTVGLRGPSAPARRLDLLAWVWIAGVVGFFSLSQSKRSAYILPIAPAVAILAGGLAERLVRGTLERWRRQACLGLLLLAALVPPVAGWSVEPMLAAVYPELAGDLRALLVLLAAGAAAAVAGLVRPRSARATVPWALLSTLASVYLLASTVLLPAVDRYKSPRAFGEDVNRLAGEGEPIASFGLWPWRAGHLYYTGREIPGLGSAEELAAYLGSDRRVFLIVEEDGVRRAGRLLDEAVLLAHRRIGSRTTYLYANRSPLTGAPGEVRGGEGHSERHPVLPVPERAPQRPAPTGGPLVGPEPGDEGRHGRAVPVVGFTVGRAEPGRLDPLLPGEVVAEEHEVSGGEDRVVGPTGQRAHQAQAREDQEPAEVQGVSRVAVGPRADELCGLPQMARGPQPQGLSGERDREPQRHAGRCGPGQVKHQPREREHTHPAQLHHASRIRSGSVNHPAHHPGRGCAS